MTKIAIFTTGGTIEKSYDPVTETLGFKSGSVLPEFLENCNASGLEIYEDDQLRDSAEFEVLDFKRILNKIETIEHDNIVVLHGTSTMVESSQYLKRSLTSEKTVVFTGAFRPYRVSYHEASFNLGAAVIAANVCNFGVYITMNGQIFDPDNCVKNISTRQFELLR